VSQIKAGESVTMVGLLDFDSHGGEVAWPAMLAAACDVVQSLELMGGAPVAFRSSGGRGVHVYCLWETGQDAYSVREWLKAALRSCGYESGTRGVGARQVEVFPKQNEVPLDGYGNQVVLPLTGLSVPIVFEPLGGDWIAGARDDVLDLTWNLSDPVPVVERPVVSAAAQRSVMGDGGSEWAALREALDAIPNGRGAAEELGYDEWRDVVFAIHHETAGAGLALAHDLSSRSGKYDASFLDERVWPFVRTEGRERVRGLGTVRRIAARYGWHEPLDDSGFEVVEDARPAAQEAPKFLPRMKRRGIPEAHHLTTDQANAQRLKNSFGSMVFVAAGRWYVWDGVRWVCDESDVYRYACRLSDLIGEEARGFRARAAGYEGSVDPADVAEAKKLSGIADALGKWALRSEMRATIEAAVGLVRKMLTMDVGALDSDPWALNCLNGVVDLRTGRLRAHSPDDYITKLVPVRYEPEARCEVWDRALMEIMGGDAAMVAFLGRWFGYCLTADVREQAFVVHWGGGSNGKSTVLETIGEVLGDYAGTAAPGLLAAAKSDRHPTEIAALFGRRMVTAHESGDGVVLREDFVKQATGGDRLTARFMREDFFEFEPTHKIQLLTNHKPQVRGTDEGIWRRVLLVPYLESFGSLEQVARGERGRVGDLTLRDRLRAAGEMQGVLAWLVRGCLAWRESGGLMSPERVRVASRDYRAEQDRVGQFIRECCEVGPELREPLTEGMGGLYPSYVAWCREGGIYPLARAKFCDELTRVVPGSALAYGRTSVEAGRRKVSYVKGLRLLLE
jgi:P4 family phage/plasmid primase-like protien